MANEIRVEKEGSAERGRYVARIDGVEGEAELTFKQMGPGVIVVNHTYAPPHMRGTGAARALLARLLADARAEGIRIVPSCSWVRDQFARHPEWRDLLAE